MAAPIKLVLLLLACGLAGALAAANLCQNIWKFPQDCQSPNCTYQIVWRYKQPDDSIEFIISTSHPNRWTGIIFSNDANVSNSDGIFAWVEDNSYVMMDAHLPDFSQAISDKHQSVTNISAHLLHGIATFRFTRKRNTNDDQDVSFADDRPCPYLVFPVDGGTVDFKTRTIVTDEYHPYISDRRVCIRSCEPANTARPAASSRPQLHFPSPSRQASAPPGPDPKPVQAPLTTTSTTTTPRPPQTTRPPSTTSSTTTSTSTSTSTSTTTTTSTSTTTTTTAAPPSTSTTTRQPTTTSTTTKRPPTSSTTTTPAPPTTRAPPPTSSSSTSAPPTTTAPKSVARPQPQFDSFTPQPSAPVSVKTPPSDPPTRLVSSSTNTNEPQWCVGRWSHPPNCRFRPPAPPDVSAYLQAPIDASLDIRPLPLELSDCTYYAQWQYLEQSDSIEFVIQTKTRNKWTGIGFGNTTRMANSDAIIGLFEEQAGRHFIMDTWLRDHVMPEIDQQQNIKQSWAKRENGTTTVKFRRARLTGDQFDFQFTDDACAYFFFPTQGGSFNAINKRMNKHETVPSVSEQRVCVKSCSAGRDLTNQNDADQATRASSIASTSSGGPSQQKPAADPSSSSYSTTPSSTATSTSQAPNLFLIQSTSATNLADKSLDSTSSINLSPSNDLNAELDGSSTSPTTAPNGHHSGHSNPFSRLAFLSEPSLRWLAGIGCVATLLAMIVFQACFTVYKNKQAYKQNLYRQSAFKQNAYLHGANLNETTSHHHHHPAPVRHRQEEILAQEADEEELDEEELDELEEEEEELDELEDYDDDMIMDNSFDLNTHHRPHHHHGHLHHHHRHSYQRHPNASHYHARAAPAATVPSHNNTAHSHPHHHHHHHHQSLHRHQPAPAQLAHHHRSHQHQAAHSHYRQAGHLIANQPLRAHQHSHAHRSQPHQPHLLAGGQTPAHSQQARPDSYFLPSQRRY